MCHAKHCTQHTVSHFALQCSKKAGRAGRRRFAMAHHRFKVRKTSVSLAATSCPSWSRACACASHKDAGVFVPEGPDDRSQAIYCLESRSKRDPSRGDGVIGSDRRATIGTTNQPWVRIRLCPTGRIFDWTRSGNKLPGYYHSVPPGQRLVSLC